MSQLLESLANTMVDNIYLGPLLALVAGFITSLSPCAISTVPLIMGYLTMGDTKNSKKSLVYSLIYAVGLAITFTSLGVLAVFTGNVFRDFLSYWYLILGLIMVLMALQFADVIHLLSGKNLLNFNKKRGAIGAFFLGLLSGLFSSPCSTPVLIVLLGLVSTKGDFISGIVLMLFYSVGYSIITVIAGTSVSFVQRLKSSSNYGSIATILKYILAAIMFALGIYLFYLGVPTL